MKKITVVGAGSFGTALAALLGGKGRDVTIFARDEKVVESINTSGFNPVYLSDIRLPETVKAGNNLSEIIPGSEIVLFATPTHAMREVAGEAKKYLSGSEVVVSVAKGIEQETLLLPSQILAEVLEGVTLEDNIGVLTGPSHAEEVALEKPTAVVATAYSKRVARIIQETFITPMFRVYFNHDILGAEIGGALKNIMAIAAGIVDGGELGDNAKAALITRGLHEMKRMGATLGASQDTFSGLTGMGDLIVTCTSRHSRNRFVGYHIGKGKTLREITDNMSMVAEGVFTTRSVHQWSHQNRVDMPITSAVYKVLFENIDPKSALHTLMTRNAKDEIMI